MLDVRSRRYTWAYTKHMSLRSKYSTYVLRVARAILLEETYSESKLTLFIVVPLLGHIRIEPEEV